MFLTFPAQIGALAMAAVCLFTFLGGGRPQRVASSLVLLGWVASSATLDRSYHAVQINLFIIDAIALTLFVMIALAYRRSWLIWLTAFHLLAIATHIAAELDKRIYSLAYITAYMIWSYLLLAALAWGGVEGWLERRRRRR